MKKGILIIVLLFVVASFAQTEKPVEEKQFIYVLHIVPKYLDRNNWTEKENKIVNDHFEKLKKMFSEGTITFAGRTENWDEKTFGIVVYRAESIDRAKEIAESDPAVKNGLMNFDVFPFKTVFPQANSK